jgi:hypothetical protein
VDAAAQTWNGGVPVEKPVWASIGFTSAAGHASLPMPAVEIAPTIDRPPSIVVDEPSPTLTLQVADDVKIRGQAFDDWGLDRILVRIGPDARHLADPVPLAGVVLADRPPDTQATVSSVLTMEQLGLAPGKSAAFTLLVRDTKGQITETKPFIVTVVQRYKKNAGIGTVIALMIPYTVWILISWIVLYVAWFLLGIPWGPGSPVTL